MSHQTSSRIQIRNACVDDVEAIYQLLLPYAEQDIILLRDRDNIFQHLQEFLVADFDGALAGVVCEQWLSGLGVSKIFALTYVTDFFVKQGYAIVSKESLPHKIWMVRRSSCIVG